MSNLIGVVQVRATPEFIYLSSCAVKHFSIPDPEGVKVYLASNVDADTLGAGIRRCLEGSRQITAEEEKELLDQKKANDRDALTVHFQMETYHYKTQRELFLNMSACRITKESDGVICFSPFNHDRLKGWSGIAESNNVILDESASNRELGEGLSLTLSRCTSVLI